MNRAPSIIKNGFKKVSHVLFDLDGLLLDTEKIYTQAIKNVIAHYGKEYTPEINQKVLGLQAPDLAQTIINYYNLPLTVEEFLHEKYIEQKKLQVYNANLMPDTETVYKRVIGNIAKRYNKEYTTDVMRKILGTTTKDTCIIAVKEMKLPINSEKFYEFFDQETKALLPNCDFMPGAEKFVRHLHKNKIPIAIATSSIEDAYELKTKKYKEFFSLFHHKVTGGSDPEVKMGKPSPEIFLVCAQRFPDKPKPAQCLVLEDAPNGVKAALNAGMQCVMIPDQQLVTPDFKSEATLTLKSLEELKPELFGLPPY